MPTLGSHVSLRCRSLTVAPALALLVAAGLSSGCGSAAKPAATNSGSGSTMASNNAGGSSAMTSSSGGNSGSAATTGSGGSMQKPKPAEPGEALVQSMANELAQRYVVGPLEVDKLGYRVDWNVSNATTSSRVKLAVAAGDSIFTIDQGNVLTRIRRETGDRLWRTPVAEPIEAVHGINRVASVNRDLVEVTTHSDVWVFDAQNGDFVAKNNLFRVSSTAPVQFGPYFIYGSISGQLIWFQHEVGTQWRAYQLGGAIRETPVRYNDLVIAVTENGETSALDAGNTARYWKKQARGNIVAPPAVGPQAVYVVSLDQHLYAYDLNTGRVRWFRLTDSPLRYAPVYLNDTLYLYVPTEGLQAFDPMPEDVYYNGRVRWTAEGVSGEVVGMHRGRLLVWDSEARVMSLVTAANGDMVERISMPKVSQLVVDGMSSGEMFAVGDDGKVMRMVPRM